MELELTALPLPLRVNWKLSRSATTEKLNFIVTLREDGQSARSEVAPNARYGETPELIRQEFTLFTELQESMGYRRALDAAPWRHSLRFALESAWLKLQSLKQGVALHAFLGLPAPGAVATSMSVPIMEKEAVAGYVADIRRFPALKIKVGADSAWDMVSAVASAAPGTPLRIDGNEAWNDLDTFLRFQDQIDSLPVEFIEQPFPAARKDLYQALHTRTPHIVMADESIEDVDNIEELATMFRAVNIKLMKTGSLTKARDFLRKSRDHGLKTMVGCMVETSLGISYAMELASLMDWADLDGYLLLKEDPYRLVTEEAGILRLT
jgi:L-alanine-DL-glutamate epimerase-like enolase superfamily enzyme